MSFPVSSVYLNLINEQLFVRICSAFQVVNYILFVMISNGALCCNYMQENPLMAVVGPVGAGKVSLIELINVE